MLKTLCFAFLTIFSPYFSDLSHPAGFADATDVPTQNPSSPSAAPSQMPTCGACPPEVIEKIPSQDLDPGESFTVHIVRNRHFGGGVSDIKMINLPSWAPITSASADHITLAGNAPNGEGIYALEVVAFGGGGEIGETVELKVGNYLPKAEEPQWLTTGQRVLYYFCTFFIGLFFPCIVGLIILCCDEFWYGIVSRCFKKCVSCGHSETPE